MTTTLKWGFVTEGKQCADFANAVQSYRKGSDVQHVLYAVSNLYYPDGEGRDFINKFNIQKVYDDYKQMAEHVDVLHVVEHLQNKFKIIKYCLEKGKHVVVVPPMAMNLKETKALTGLAKKNKLLLMEGHYARYSEAYQKLKEEIKKGTLGQVTYLRANYGKKFKYHPRNMSVGHSLIVARGTYLLQLAQFIWDDEPGKVTVTAVGDQDDNDYTWATFVLEYPGGRRAVLNMQDQCELSNDADIYGTKGRATLSKPIRYPMEITIGKETLDFPQHSSKQPYFIENAGGNIAMALEVGRCIKNGEFESPLMSHKDMEERAQFLDEIRKQLKIKFAVD